MFFLIYVSPLPSHPISGVPTPLSDYVMVWHSVFSTGNKSSHNVSRYEVLNNQGKVKGTHKPYFIVVPHASSVFCYISVVQ